MCNKITFQKTLAVPAFLHVSNVQYALKWYWKIWEVGGQACADVGLFVN